MSVRSEHPSGSPFERLPLVTYSLLLEPPYPAVYISPQLERLFGYSPADCLASAVTDAESRYLRVNEALARLNGAPLADHFGRTLAEIAPSIAASVQPVLDEVHRSGVAASDRELHVDVDGEEPVVVASFFPIATETETHYVLRLLAEGGSYAEIGSTLFLSPDTVRAHAQRAMTKLGARTRTQAVAVALRDAVIG